MNNATIKQQHALGQAIAQLYCAAQGVSQEASTAACDLMENASFACKLGFDQVMIKSEYNTRALTPVSL